MQLSIVIVNYNVCHFLEQCLLSVERAIQHLEAEVFVVDNNSYDGSVDFVAARFPWVKLIANTENLGFSKANNQALKVATGKYKLLLNPDTIVQEDTLIKCYQFMEAHPEAGALGIKMIDGSGTYLPESKRGLPTPWVSFCKITGLGKLLPKSKVFNSYYLGYLPENESNEVEILSGAFMFMRSEALDKTGLLDETFFMFGEDIDLSYRITLAGYKNFYYPVTQIIHYKGESTKKGSLNYVFVFYQAMIIFAEKHFRSKFGFLFKPLIYSAVYGRAVLSVLYRMLKRFAEPLIDASLIYWAMNRIGHFWEQSYKADLSKPFPPEFYSVVIPTHIGAWLLMVTFSGGYDKPFQKLNLIKGLFWGTLLISAVSNFTDAYRMSKALILIGAASALVIMPLWRLVFGIIKQAISKNKEGSKRIGIVASKQEFERVSGILKETNKQLEVLGRIESADLVTTSSLGRLSNLADVISLNRLNEIIFCSRDLKAAAIIETMTKVAHSGVSFRIVADESNFIIGSHSKNERGDFYALPLELKILHPASNRNKRILDIFIALICLMLSPLGLWFQRYKSGYIKNLVMVILGLRSFVGFRKPKMMGLTNVKKGILTPTEEENSMDDATAHRFDLLYAKDYSPAIDFNIILKHWQVLGKP